MHAAWREGAVSHLGLYRVEVAVVAQAIGDTVDRLRPEVDESLDPLEQLLRGVGEEAWLDDEERDPLLDRLFPAVHPDDPRASAEHRRYSEDDLRQQKADEADLVLAALLGSRPVAREGLTTGDEPEPVHDVAVPDAAADAWLRTLNATRIALAMELDITTADDAEALAEMGDDDERMYAWSVYEFTGELQAVLLAMRGYE